MARLRRTLGVLVAVVAMLVLASVTTAATRHRETGAYCFGGPIAAGQYASITVAGNCSMPTGLVQVTGNVTVQAGAALNAITHATLIVGGNLIVDEGGVLGLGCSPAIGCSFTTHDRVFKTLVASDPASLIVHSATIGAVVSIGGSNGVNCDFNPLIGSPNYTTFEDNTINGNATVLGYDSCWFGFIRNSVSGSVLLEDNTLADPDAMEVVTNVIAGDLACYGNAPAPQLGDSGGLPNIVRGAKLGQCSGL